VATQRKTGVRSTERKTLADAVLDAGETSVLDLLGVAGIDLVYLRLSSLLCAIDRVQRRESNRPGQQTRRHNRGPRPLKTP